MSIIDVVVFFGRINWLLKYDLVFINRKSVLKIECFKNDI